MANSSRRGETARRSIIQWINLPGVAVTGVVAFLLAATAIGFTIDAPHLLRLQHQRGEIMGDVTRMLPDNHGMVEVRYEVAGVPYVGTFAPHLQVRPIRMGSLVRVYYEQDDPRVAFIAAPEDILTEQLPSWVAGSTVFSIVIVIAVLTFRSSKKIFR